jgi:DNA-binding MurR/RpiR family transcriptional regulator
MSILSKICYNIEKYGRIVVAQALISRINAYYDGLSKADQVISDYLLRNMDTAARLSIQDLSLLICVSTATLSRFAKKIGYASFQELKLDLHAMDKDTSQSDDFFSALTPTDSFQEILAKEGKSLHDGVLNLIIESSGYDIRQVINSIQLQSKYDHLSLSESKKMYYSI